MRKFFYLSFIVLLFSCSKNNEIKTVNVSFPEPDTNFVAWLDIFPDVEIVSFFGEELPVFGPYCKLIVHDSNYYMIDYMNGQKVHRFDQNGKYLNSIGTQGRGPEEYTSIYDVMVDNHGNVVVCPHGESALVTYSPEGTFLRRSELPYPCRFFAYNGFNFHYVGVKTDQGYQLYITDSNGQSMGEFLPQPSSAPYSFTNSNSFSLYDNTVNFCPAEGNEIYQLKDGKMETKYRFDFGRYNITDEYYKKTMDELMAYYSSNPIAYKYAFHESAYCAILEVVIQADVDIDPRLIYGLLDKKKDEWKWFNWDETDFLFLRSLDKEYAYFLASAELMKEIPGMTERFPLLNTLSQENDMIILKCKTESIKL